ncbi:MAG: hypothetical protein H0T85_04300 [Geodermatophilaceae bacterium]|nr:hypothetical protein [Geodermatophilaceae bacterium]
MVFLVALVVTAVLLVVMWRAIGPDAPGSSGAGPRRQLRPRPTWRGPQVPPDDNEDFLRDLDRRARPEE